MKTRSTLRKIGITALLGIVLSGAWAQGTQERSVGEFTGVKTSGIFTVTLSPAATSSVKVEAEESVMKDIKTEVKDNVLVIYSDENLKSQLPVNIIVSIKELKSVNVSGAAKIKGEGEFTTDKVTIDATGAGAVTLQLKANEVKVNGGGAGNIKLTGSATNLMADLSGAASLKAYEMEAQNASIDASGASNAKVTATKSITADASGASTINYKGSPASKNINKSGSSSVRNADAATEEVISKGDTTKVRVGDSSVMIIKDEDGEDAKKDEKKKKKDDKKDNEFKHWKGFDIGVNGFLNADNKLGVSESFRFLELDYARSITWSYNFMEKDIHIYKNYVNFVTGLGFEFSQYGFRNNTTLDPHASYITASYDSLDYKVNRLRTSWINLPLLIEVNAGRNPNKSFHIAGGILLGYRMHAKTKQEYTIDKREYEVSTKDDFNLSPFRYSATVRAGYGDFTLFANYALSTLFEKNKGPKLYPFSAGIALNFD